MIAIVIPIYNDWSAFSSLVRDLNDIARGLSHPLMILAVNDGSTLPPASLPTPQVSSLHSIELITLNCNLGHQRAIAIGFSECLRRENLTAVLVMDSDGEDSPAYIGPMLAALTHHPESIIVASRAKRSERLIFRACYLVYKRTFCWLTGQFIDFGNYCLLPMAAVRRVAYMSDSWNHFAATIVKSHVPLQRVPTERAKRYCGTSSMNLVGLVMHGLSAISVFSDRVLTRLLLVACATSLFAIGSGTTAVLLRLLTDLAIPGWATNVFGLSCLLFFQSLTLLTVVVFINLSSRSSVPFIPGVHASAFIAHIAPFPVHGDI